MPQRTHIANVARLTALMDETGLDVLGAAPGQNVTYLSGVVYPGNLAAPCGPDRFHPAGGPG